MNQPTNPSSGIWVFPGREGQPSSGVVLGAGGAIIVDPGAAKDELDALDGPARSADQEVVAVVLTHEQPGIFSDLLRWPDAQRLSPANFPGDESEAQVDLPVGGWQLIPLQSPGRLGVYNPTQKILFCGDMLSESDIPSLANGSQAYLDSLERVEALDAKLIVPAFGEVAEGKRAIRQRIERDRNYVYALIRQVQTAMSAPTTLERALEVARSIYEDYPFVEAHLDNVRWVWEESS